MNTPFFHEELEVKQHFLEIARSFANSQEIEQELAAAMLYANLSEYLVHHLCESLNQIIFSGSKAFWNGIVYLDLRDSTEKMTLGQVAKELKRYGFPSKEIIIPLVENISRNRNLIMHKMLRTPADQLGEIDEAIRDLVKDSEELIVAIDDIYRGLPPNNVTETDQGSNTKTKLTTVENNEGEITVQEKEVSNGNRTSKGTTRKKAS